MNGQQINFQIQNTLQQMQSSEQRNSAMLRQLSNQLQEMAQREASAVQQIQQLSQVFNQMSQEVQRTSQFVSQQQFSQPQVGVNQQYRQQ